MMCHWNVRQENLYKKYVNIGNKIAKSLLNKNNEDKLSDCYAWGLLTQEGIWKLPIAKQYNGAGLSWDECVIALEGLVFAHQNMKLLVSIIEHLGRLYLVSQYGTISQKDLYLPYLIQGENFEDKIFEILQNKTPKILCDYINFKRLLYAITASKLSLSIIEKYKKKSKRQQRFVTDYEKIKYNILTSRQILYLTNKEFIL